MTAPTALAVIPARGGSVGVPGKNLARVGGVSLVARAVRAALAAGIERVAVSTDSAAIAAEARAAGAEVVERPAAIAGGAASSESALAHALAEVGRRGAALPDVLVFIQATSPFIDPADLAAAVRRVGEGAADVVFAAAETHAFVWREGPGGMEPVGHPSDRRPRRQDLEPRFRETGAFYVMGAAGFLAAGYRFFGTVARQEVAPATAMEIDSEADLALARALAPALDPTLGAVSAPGAVREPDVDALITDFDGVHTDDRAVIGPDGAEYVAVKRGDGLGIERLRADGAGVFILSTEANPIVTVRAAKLGVPVLHAVRDKAAALGRWLAEAGVDPARAAFLGNDVNDLPAMALVAWPCAVADAHPDVLAAARLVTAAKGGHGAVRELADAIVRGRARARSQAEDPTTRPGPPPSSTEGASAT